MSFFDVSTFSSRTRPCSVLLGRSGKTPPQSFFKKSVFKNLYPARLTITAPGARQFLRGKPNLHKLNSCELKFFQRPASLRCATADCDQSRLLMPSPAFS